MPPATTGTTPTCFESARFGTIIAPADRQRVAACVAGERARRAVREPRHGDERGPHGAGSVHPVRCHPAEHESGQVSHGGPAENESGASRRFGDERGMALLVALMAILLVMALGTALALGASVGIDDHEKFPQQLGSALRRRRGARAGRRRFEGDHRLERCVVRRGFIGVCGRGAGRHSGPAGWPAYQPGGGRQPRELPADEPLHELPRWMQRQPTVRGVRTTRAGSRSPGGH